MTKKPSCLAARRNGARFPNRPASQIGTAGAGRKRTSLAA
jgi:hypothetical protein